MKLTQPYSFNIESKHIALHITIINYLSFKRTLMKTKCEFSICNIQNNEKQSKIPNAFDVCAKLYEKTVGLTNSTTVAFKFQIKKLENDDCLKNETKSNPLHLDVKLLQN